MEPIGQTLRDARERQGISLEMARQALRIHGSHLEALEADEFDRLPAPAYARAFLRQYASYLGLDPAPLVAALEDRACEPLSPVPVPWSFSPPPRDMLFCRGSWTRVGKAALLVSLVGGVAAGVFFSGRTGILRRAPLLSTARKISAGATQLFAGKPSLAPVRPAAPRPHIPFESGTPPMPQGRATICAAQSPQPDLVEGAAEGVKVLARVSQRCWVRVRADDQVFFQGILAPGASRTWQARRLLEVTVGNAGGVRLQVNGKEYGPLGRPGQVVRRTFRSGAPTRVASGADTP